MPKSKGDDVARLTFLLIPGEIPGRGACGNDKLRRSVNKLESPEVREQKVPYRVHLRIGGMVCVVRHGEAAVLVSVNALFLASGHDIDDGDQEAGGEDYSNQACAKGQQNDGKHIVGGTRGFLDYAHCMRNGLARETDKASKKQRNAPTYVGRIQAQGLEIIGALADCIVIG